jgi:hypothetical protein
MIMANEQAGIARNLHFGNCRNVKSVASLENDNADHYVQNAHVMSTENIDIIRKWLDEVIDDKEERREALWRILDLKPPQRTRMKNGARRLRADELLIVAAYFDAELPAMPGYGKARIAKKSNDNDAEGPVFPDDDADELWSLAEAKVEEAERKAGVLLTNEEYIDRIIKLYNTLQRRSGK